MVKIAPRLPANSKLKKHFDFVSLLGRHGKSPKKRKYLLAAACPGEVDAIAELFTNFLKGNLKVPKQVFQRLERHQKKIREIADKKTSRKHKKELLGSQTGGLLQFLIPAIAPFAVQLFRKIFKI